MMILIYQTIGRHIQKLQYSYPPPENTNYLTNITQISTVILIILWPWALSILNELLFAGNKNRILSRYWVSNSVLVLAHNEWVKVTGVVLCCVFSCDSHSIHSCFLLVGYWHNRSLRIASCQGVGAKLPETILRETRDWPSLLAIHIPQRWFLSNAHAKSSNNHSNRSYRSSNEIKDMVGLGYDYYNAHRHSVSNYI
jgi:hypothetical protein